MAHISSIVLVWGAATVVVNAVLVRDGTITIAGMVHIRDGTTPSWKSGVIVLAPGGVASMFGLTVQVIPVERDAVKWNLFDGHIKW